MYTKDEDAIEWRNVFQFKMYFGPITYRYVWNIDKNNNNNKNIRKL